MATTDTPGQFPFRLLPGPDETRYLKWVRNHSNYMAERGFVDYMRIVAILVRGILINFLVLVPILLVGAVLIALGYGDALRTFWAEVQGQSLGLMRLLESWNREAPVMLTPWVAAVAGVHVVMFPIFIRLFKVSAHTRAVRSGSESSVKMRDLYERSFGLTLILIMAAVVIDALPLVVHYFHTLRDLGYRGVATTIAGGSSVLGLSAAGKVLSFLDSGKKQALAKVAIGLLGIILPFIVVLYATEYMVYSDAFTLPWWLLVVVPGVLAVGIVLVMVVGIARKTLRNYGWLFVMLAGMTGIAIGVWLLGGLFPDPSNHWKGLVFVLIVAFDIGLFCWYAVDVNLTSVHGLYRDRLASAYLVGEDRKGDVDIEQDIDLSDICQYENGSIAPYHLINVALNLQGSKDIGIRDRNSDFFIFSKNFIGSDRTGYCDSDTMELVYPQMDLATAMAISAAAASPNMGTGTSSLMVAVMTLFNIRLGFWVPRPGKIEQVKNGRAISFADVFKHEMKQLQQRWHQVYAGQSRWEILDFHSPPDPDNPTTRNQLVGLGFSGGGIRSATINLGIAQALHASGAFDHVDYMSTVSGGGYLGSGISTLMRDARTPQERRLRTSTEGVVRVSTEGNRQRVSISDGKREEHYDFAPDAKLQVKEGDRVSAGQTLAQRPAPPPATIKDRFHWRIRPTALLREMASKLDERHRWVNLSDGGHIENLAGIELLRRRCKYIIIGDGEADPKLHFAGLATLMRYARIDLGIRIELNVDRIRPDDTGRSNRHWALGTVWYPNDNEPGYLLYLKSSYCGHEDEVITQYRSENPTFPHESTADQFFDEGQFEAYRSLGQHIGEAALHAYPKSADRSRPPDAKAPDEHTVNATMHFSKFQMWFKNLAEEETASINAH